MFCVFFTDHTNCCIVTAINGDQENIWWIGATDMFDEVISNSSPPCSLSLTIYNLMDSLLLPLKKNLFPFLGELCLAVTTLDFQHVGVLSFRTTFKITIFLCIILTQHNLSNQVGGGGTKLEQDRSLENSIN